MHSMIRKSHRMQKHKFDICVSRHFLQKPHPSMKNSVSMFHAPEAWKAFHDPQIPPDAKTQVWRNVSR
jgi:hypothetical protein